MNDTVLWPPRTVRLKITGTRFESLNGKRQSFVGGRSKNSKRIVICMPRLPLPKEALDRLPDPVVLRDPRGRPAHTHI